MNKSKVLNYWNFTFEGFESLEHYEKNLHEISAERGLYVIIMQEGSPIEFTEKSCAGIFGQRKPDVAIELLKEQWVSDTLILFIGQAGRKMKSCTIRKKIKKLISYGRGKKEAHFQGRYIWQIRNPFNLLLAWTVFDFDKEIPTTYELLDNFFKRHNKAPFANLQWNAWNKPYEYNANRKDDLLDYFMLNRD